MRITRLVENKDRFIDGNPNLTPEQKTELKAIFNRKPTLERLMGNWQADSKKWTYEDFKPVIDEYNMTKADKLQRKRKEQAKIKGLDGLTEGEDYEIIYTKNGVTAIWVKTYDASVRVASNSVGPELWTKNPFWCNESKSKENWARDPNTGLFSGAKWCISVPNYRGHWDSYTGCGAKYLMIFSEDENKVPSKKTCVFACRLDKYHVINGSVTKETLKYCDAPEARSDRVELYRDEFKSYYPKVDFTDLDAAVSIWWDKVVPLTSEEKYNLTLKKTGFEIREDGKFYDIAYSRSRNFFNEIKPLIEVRPDAKIAYWKGNLVLDSAGMTEEEVTEMLKHVPETVQCGLHIKDIPINSFTELGIKKICAGYKYDVSILNTNIKDFEGFPVAERGIDDFEVADAPMLTSLKGLPRENTYRKFTIHRCSLNSLKGCPDVQCIDLDYNKLTSLEGVGRADKLSVRNNNLKTLKGGSNIKDIINASNNPDLEDWGDVSDDTFVIHKNTKLKDEYID